MVSRPPLPATRYTHAHVLSLSLCLTVSPSDSGVSCTNDKITHVPVKIKTEGAPFCYSQRGYREKPRSQNSVCGIKSKTFYHKRTLYSCIIILFVWHRQTEGTTNMQTDRWFMRDQQTEHTDIERQTCIQKDRMTDKQNKIHNTGHSGRQNDRQNNRHVDKHRE